jgi:peptidoglycan lytic transglycosylase G
MLSRAFVAITVGLVVSVLLAGGAVLWGYAQYQRPGPAEAPVTVVLQPGSGLPAIARHLADAGVLARADVFVLAARLSTGGGRDLKAGEYLFPAHASMAQVLVKLRAGETVVRRLTVPEGLTSREVMDLLEAAEGLTGEADETPPEGMLLPETYHYSYADRRADLVLRMRTAMRTTLEALWAARQPDLPLETPEQALVLASIVEKETAVAAERARIAGVFLNRLRRGMRLQSDPTVLYALTQGRGSLQRPLSRADLAVDSPYNTYLHEGLPPGPIANPGRAALAATLQPLKTDELYFVADGSGGHAFASSLAEHQRNVVRWHRLQRAEKAGAAE